MIDFTENIVNAQIFFALGLIAFSLFFHFFVDKTPISKGNNRK